MPNFTSLKLKQLLLHGIHPICILRSFFDTLGFYSGKKWCKCHEISGFRPSLYSNPRERPDCPLDEMADASI